ncbi:MAG: anaerobic sulfatase maturase [Candidatus Omnitrophota bacterium]
MNFPEIPILSPPARKPLQSVLIKPAGADCNLDCSYCFYLEKSELYPQSRIHRMSIEILEEMVKQIMRAGRPAISFGWQGGEPTLMGLDFFRQAVAFQQKYGVSGQTVGNGLQTNGLLVTKEWRQFFKEYSFLIGLSLDGTEHIHDKYRFTKGGGPSWSKVSESARRMLDEGVAVNALTVVNDYSAQFPREIYDYHKNLGFEFMQFIPCVEPDPSDPRRAAPYSVSAEQYGRFLCEIFDCWKGDFRNGLATTSIRYFDSVFHTYVDLPAPECTLLKECGCYVVIEHNGDVYSCDFFVEPEWKLGNLMQGDIVDFLNCSRQRTFGCMKSNLPPECTSCQWLPHCWGGCTKDRLRDLADNGSNHFCLSYKMFFQYADAELRRLAENWKTQRRHEEEEEQCRLQSLSSSTAVSKPGRNDPCPCGSGKKYKKCCGSRIA